MHSMPSFLDGYVAQLYIIIRANRGSWNALFARPVQTFLATFVSELGVRDGQEARLGKGDYWVVLVLAPDLPRILEAIF